MTEGKSVACASSALFSSAVVTLLAVAVRGLCFGASVLLSCCGNAPRYCFNDSSWSTYCNHQHRHTSPCRHCMQVDLDLGNYERFLDITLTRDNNLTTGKVYQVGSCSPLHHLRPEMVEVPLLPSPPVFPRPFIVSCPPSPTLLSGLLACAARESQSICALGGATELHSVFKKGHAHPHSGPVYAPLVARL